MTEEVLIVSDVEVLVVTEDIPELLDATEATEVYEVAEQGPSGPPGRDGVNSPLQYYTAAVALSGHIAVTLNTSGLATPADCRTESHAAALAGATIGAAEAGASAIVRQTGLLESPGWGLTPDLPVYLGESGALVQTVPSSALFVKQIGRALSSTSVLIDIQPAIFLN